ncbi:kinesin-like protein KIF27 isoform X2 [Amphiura filiformis]|uniref:kinesin-like protein KIF27 isoform X2 n=1 Tax=Amphiura filiformis TaxID=82378 RepID=UPI003B21493A
MSSSSSSVESDHHSSVHSSVCTAADMQEVPVRVAVRVRPLLPQERLHHHQLCVKVLPNKNQIIVGKDRAFTFDHVLSSRTSQENVYQTCVDGLVRSLFEGYNATVFAYGQTGSGKTYTIGGHNSINLTEDEIGIIARAVQQMFDIIKANHNVDYILRVSYIEVYKEELRDLLDMETKDMHIREDEQGNTVILGCKEVICTSVDEVLSCLEAGSAHRHTGATNMNEHSSRSHSLFTINVEQRWEDAGNEDAPPNSTRERDEVVGEDGEEEERITNCMASKFHFVDLAGSERANRTGNAGERFKESVFINSGLLSLGNVISALSDPKRKTTHIPYRDSKITRILKDSLGGNAKTCMLTCISPSAVNFDETLNSLKYANRARNIKNKPIINRDVQSTRIAAMQTEIQALREELQRHRLGTANPDTGGDDKEKVRDMESKLINIRTECSHYKVCTEEASKIFDSLQDSETLSKSQISAIRNWMDMVDEMNDAANLNSASMAGHEAQRKVTDLESKLKKAMNDLASDEEIFAEKNRECIELKAKVQDLESSSEKGGHAYEDAIERIRQQEAELVEQQTQIQELQNLLHQMKDKGMDDVNESLTIEVPVTSRRAMSVPAHMVGRRRVTSTGEPLLSARPQSRKLHTSPPLFSLERIVQGFRARSQLLIKRIEEEDEVMQEDMSGSSGDDEEEDDDGIHGDEDGSEVLHKNRSLGKTWSIHGSQGSNKSAQKGKKDKSKKRMAPKRQNTITKMTKIGDREKLPKAGPEIDKLRSGAEEKQQQVRESHMRVHKAQQKTRDLALNIRLKEELIRELVKTGKESEAMNRKYSERIKRLEKEAEQARGELKDAQQALHELSAQDKAKMEGDYKKKMVAARSKVKSLERKQQEMGKTMKAQGQSEKKISELEAAVGRMKQHQELLQQRLKDEAERKAKLEREMQKDHQRIKELEIRNEHQQKILKRKTEEVASAKRKLRQGSASSTGPEGDEVSKMEEQRRWLDSEVEKVLTRKRKMTELEEELAKREEILAKKEALQRQKGQIEIKKLRSSQVLSKDITGLSSRIESVEREIEAKTNVLRASMESQRGPLKEEIKGLKKERDHLHRQRAILDDKLQQGNMLSPREERRLIELDEGIDALEAAIEFKNDAIVHRQKELRSTELTQSEVMLAGRFNSLSTDDARTLLTRYFEKVIDLREGDKRKDLEISELQMKIDEQSRFAREVEGALENARMELDRRLTIQEKEHEQRVQLLVRQMKDGSNLDITGMGDVDVKAYENKIQELEKDLYYYKKTSRELKKKLREFVSASASSTTHNGKERNEVQSSTTSITSHSGDSRHEGARTGTPVRKSRREVRELSEAEVSLRRSGASQSGSLSTDGRPKNGSNPWT